MRRLGIALVLLLAACGDDDDDRATATTVDGEPPPPGSVVDVAGALAAADGTTVEVSGHLIALPDGTAELCGGPIMESAPPRCGEPALPVDGLDDPAGVPGAASVGGWVEGDVVLRGTVDGGRLAAG